VTTHAVPAPDACSVGFDRTAVSAYGTAASATFFVALEQPGPWGRLAATESHLPAALGSSLDHACSSRGGRLTLLRRPGRHADEHVVAGHTAYLAWAGPEPWLLEATVLDPAVLLDVDLDALARGDREAVAASFPGAVPAAPVLLVCTNGRRDVCCAVRGRPVALDAAQLAPGRVWEASHTGGHRFAPTGVLLPHGATLARLDATSAASLLESADRDEAPLSLSGPLHDRGRSALSGPVQAAVAHVRHREGVTSLTALWGGETATSDLVSVVHRDGRSWTVEVTQEAPDLAHDGGLPESCGKAEIAVLEWRTRTVD
jgi:hypothetical protein